VQLTCRQSHGIAQAVAAELNVAAELGVLHARKGLVAAESQMDRDHLVHDFLTFERQKVQGALQCIAALPQPLRLHRFDCGELRRFVFF
jgi:hypothetical protein